MVGGIWKNIDDAKNATYFNWASEEPYDYPGCNCVNIDSQGYWHTYYACNVKFYYICGIPGTGETGSISSPTEKNK